MSKIYRNKWYEQLEKINEIKNNNNYKSTNEELINLIQRYIIIGNLASKEIYENEPLTNQAREFGDTGLDCFDMILQTVILSMKQINRDEISEIIKKILPLSIEEQINIVS